MLNFFHIEVHYKIFIRTYLYKRIKVEINECVSSTCENDGGCKDELNPVTGKWPKRVPSTPVVNDAKIFFLFKETFEINS